MSEGILTEEKSQNHSASEDMRTSVIELQSEEVLLQ